MEFGEVGERSLSFLAPFALIFIHLSIRPPFFLVTQFSICPSIHPLLHPSISLILGCMPTAVLGTKGDDTTFLVNGLEQRSPKVCDQQVKKSLSVSPRNKQKMPHIDPIGYYCPTHSPTQECSFSHPLVAGCCIALSGPHISSGKERKLRPWNK